MILKKTSDLGRAGSNRRSTDYEACDGSSNSTGPGPVEIACPRNVNPRQGNGRVVGLMPQPEHAIGALTGPSDDGLGLFYSARDSVLAA
jgi:hypothetical protein